MEWLAFPSSRAPSQPRGQICVSCIADLFLTSEPPEKTCINYTSVKNKNKNNQHTPTSQHPCSYCLGPKHCALTILLMNEPPTGLPEFALFLVRSVLNTEARKNFCQLLLKYLHFKNLHVKCSAGYGSAYVSVQFSSVDQSCLTLCNPMDCSTPCFPICHQLQELGQTHLP